MLLFSSPLSFLSIRRLRRLFRAAIFEKKNIQQLPQCMGKEDMYMGDLNVSPVPSLQFQEGS